MEQKVEQPATDRLPNFPITFFAIIMGMMGLTLALHAAEPAFHAAGAASSFVLGVSVVMLVAIAAIYLMKIIRHGHAVKEEWHHPIKIAFFPTVSISLLLLAVAVLTHDKTIALVLWIAGTILQAVLTLAVVSSWIGHRPFQPMHLTPAWFIPAVGNVIVPVAGAQLGFAELSWLFFATGLIFWIVLLTLVMNRLIFHDPIPARLFPTLMILVAPPAVAFIAWLKLTGEVDAFARILINSGYVFAAVVLTQAGKFRSLPFALSWWALSFPVAALTIASFAFAKATGSQPHLVIGFVLLAALVLIVTLLLVRTAKAIAARKICQPE